MRKVIKVSPSILNEFAQFKGGSYEKWGKTQEDFRQYVLGEYSPNPATSRGTAVHSILEGKPGVNTLGGVAVHEKELKTNWVFTPDVFLSVHDYGKRYAHAAHEVADTIRIELARATVYMNMRFDCLDALELHEFKTSSKPKKYADYYDSLQWRCYMMALPDVQKVNYHVFQMPEAVPGNIIADVKTYTFTYQREANNDATVLTWLNELTAWVLDDGEMFGKLSLDFARIASKMGDIVQAVYDEEESPVNARRALYKAAGNYDELQDYLNACLIELKDAK
jgi:hypothetical protein